MGSIRAGFRVVFKPAGMKLADREEYTTLSEYATLSEPDPKKHPRAYYYFGKKPPWGGVDVLSVPVSGTPGERASILVRSLMAAEENKQTPDFMMIAVEKEFEIADTLAVRWFAHPDDTLNEVHEALAQRVRSELGPKAMMLAASMATQYSQGALGEKVWEGVMYYFVEKELRTVSGRSIIRIFDPWAVTDENLRAALEKVSPLLAPDHALKDRTLFRRVGLATHWLVTATGERNPINRFLAHFLVLETLSWLALHLPGNDSIPAPWEQRGKDLRELQELAKSTSESFLGRIVERLYATRYQIASLPEAFAHLVRLHPADLKESDTELFSQLNKIRNDLLHGRISEPPSILEPESPTLALEDLAVSAMRAVLATITGMVPGRTIMRDVESENK
jgi:hypothetical protein